MSDIPQNSGDSGRDESGKFVEGHKKLGGAVAGSFSLLALLKNEIQKCPEGQDKRTYADLVIKRMLKEAIENGDIQIIKLIWNYIEGMPNQPIEHSTDGNFKVTLETINDQHKMDEDDKTE